MKSSHTLWYILITVQLFCVAVSLYFMIDQRTVASVVCFLVTIFYLWFTIYGM